MAVILPVNLDTYCFHDFSSHFHIFDFIRCNYESPYFSATDKKTYELPFTVFEWVPNKNHSAHRTVWKPFIMKEYHLVGVMDVIESLRVNSILLVKINICPLSFSLNLLTLFTQTIL